MRSYIYFIHLFKFCNFVLYCKIILKEYLFQTVSYIGNSLGWVFHPSVEMQAAYSTAQADWVSHIQRHIYKYI